MNGTQKAAGYLAAPGSGEGPGILVLHAWWGVNDDIKNFCDRLAALGFVAYAPDLYHGELATTIEDAERLSSDLDAARVQVDTSEAVDTLWSYAGTRQQGLHVVAFSLGVYFALTLSIDEPERVRAVVLFYGSGEGDLNQARASYLGHFAENDAYEPTEWVNSLENALRSAGRPVTFYRYAGVGHWFFEPGQAEEYNEAAARLAWERTIAFLREDH